MDFEVAAFVDGFWGSINEFYGTVGELLPKAMLALLIIAFGWILGISVEIAFHKIGQTKKAKKIWELTGFEDFVRKSGIKSDPAALAGTALKTTLVLFFIRSAAKVMGFFELEEFLSSVLHLIPDVVIALLILFFAIRWANTVADLTQNLLHFGDAHSKKILAAVAKNILIAFGVLAALFQIRIAPELIQTLFTAFVAMLALAGGLAFGLGGKEFVHDMLKELEKNKNPLKKDDGE